jgi:hypothetical protein
LGWTADRLAALTPSPQGADEFHPKSLFSNDFSENHVIQSQTTMRGPQDRS